MQPERLAELKRQRELVAEHLRWLDGEIDGVQSPAAAGGVPPNLPKPPFAPIGQPQASTEGKPPETPSPPRPAAPASNAVPPPPRPEEPGPSAPGSAGGAPVPELPSVDPAAIASDTRKGCLLYVFLVAALIAGTVWLLVWAGRSLREDQSRERPVGEAPGRR